MINSGTPFVLFAYAALSITAGEMAVLNATSPMWAAVMLWGALFLAEPVTLPQAGCSSYSSSAFGALK